MNICEVTDVLRALRERRREVMIEADGCDDRIYLTEREWEAVFEALELVEGEF